MGDGVFPPPAERLTVLWKPYKERCFRLLGYVIPFFISSFTGVRSRSIHDVHDYSGRKIYVKNKKVVTQYFLCKRNARIGGLRRRPLPLYRSQRPTLIAPTNLGDLDLPPPLRCRAPFDLLVLRSDRPESVAAINEL